MNYEFLKRLYRVCALDTAVDPNGPSALFVELSTTQAAHKCFAERLEKAQILPDELSGLEDLEAEECLAYEEQGFINGFRLGFMLAQELKEVTPCPE